MSTAGTGTTGQAAQMMGRDALLIDLAGTYTAMCRERVGGLFVAQGDSVASGEPAAAGAASVTPTAGGKDSGVGGGFPGKNRGVGGGSDG